MAQVLLAAVLVLGLLEPVISFSPSKSEPRWGYEKAQGILGPDHWFTAFPDCGGDSQSPINIDTTEAVFNPQLQEAFNFKDYQTTPGQKLTLKNVAGRTVEVEYPEKPEIFISGGNLNGRYRLVQFHFHWGKKNSQGSEHQVNKATAPLEMHLVHILEESFGASKQLAVLGFLFKVRRRNNKAFDNLLAHFNDVEFSDNEIEVPSFAVADLLPRKAARRLFYRYNGSLTTPPCSETVVWTVFKDRIPISSSQLETFRKLREKRRPGMYGLPPILVDNFRPVQNLNLREVQTNDKRGLSRSKPWR